MTTTPLTDQQLDADREMEIRTLDLSPLMSDRSAAVISGHLAALLAEIDLLRTDAAAELLPAWEAMYEPGNVSDYLIGYANSEAAAKGAAEAWMRSESEVTGRLEWTAQNPLDGYDTEFELVQRHDDGIDTGPGITVRHRAAAVEETHVVADDSDDPEHVDDCPGCTAAVETDGTPA
ncbi:hypothetical protein M2155_000648 [Streptomyces sp. SAI-119]|uniref:hypothetical protein n=1 Tax=Streptomyces sp. SAI-119 TaxID=2940541 RepID=UPI002474E211|nr:hypothetical protein [Streptomyces sp. SAI-119]MDH6448240.1 hypothetical protein [Streptomyces sp. SAI-119]